MTKVAVLVMFDPVRVERPEVESRLGDSLHSLGIEKLRIFHYNPDNPEEVSYHAARWFKFLTKGEMPQYPQNNNGEIELGLEKRGIRWHIKDLATRPESKAFLHEVMYGKPKEKSDGKPTSQPDTSNQ